MYLASPPENLAMEIDDPRERITFVQDTHVGRRTLDPSISVDAYHLEIGDAERWLVKIKKRRLQIWEYSDRLETFFCLDMSARRPRYDWLFSTKQSLCIT